jgi:hypothetical protein
VTHPVPSFEAPETNGFDVTAAIDELQDAQSFYLIEKQRERPLCRRA